MELAGYAEIKKDATTGISDVSIERFTGQICRVWEFDTEGGVLVLDRQATGIATFDKCDVRRSFKCKEHGDILTPPGLNLIEQMAYVTKVMTRKGGYVPLLREMIILASIHKGEFTDTILWARQNESSEAAAGN